jgi:hypothetical protein
VTDSGAERVRRHRLHEQGNHSLCHPQRCPEAELRAVTLGRRGQLMWRDMKGDELPPAARVLLQEACRTADRLDKLDALLAGNVDGWITVDVPETGPATLVIDKALSEARQQQLALKGLMAELRAIGAIKGATGDAKPDDAPKGGGILALVSRIGDKQATG